MKRDSAAIIGGAVLGALVAAWLLPTLMTPQIPEELMVAGESTENAQFRLYRRSARPGIGWVVAALTGMAALYVGQAFGSGLDYPLAFLWGSGVDTALKGLSAVLAKLGVE